MKTMKMMFVLFVILSVMTAFVTGASAGAKTDTGKDKANLININTAGADELQELPRIGPKMSQRIIDYREKNGKFKKKEDLMKVPGIGEKTFKGFEDMITI